MAKTVRKFRLHEDDDYRNGNYRQERRVLKSTIKHDRRNKSLRWEYESTH